MKKVLYFLAKTLLLMSLCIHCFARPVQKKKEIPDTSLSTYSLYSIFNGFSTGFSLGDSWTAGNISTQTIATLSFPTIPLALSTNTINQSHLRKNTVAGSVFAGYGCTCEYLYFGVEGFAKGAKANPSVNFSGNFVLNAAVANTITVSTTKLRSFEYGGDFRPGVLLTPETLLYAKVGAAFNRLSLIVNSTVTGTLGVFPAATIPTVEYRSKNIVGLRLGLGLEQKIADCWTIRADYVFTNYKRIGSSTNTAVAIPPAPFPGTATFTDFTRARTINNTVMLGLSRYW